MPTETKTTKQNNKIEVFLDDDTLSRLEAQADAKGLRRSALARSYILAGLATETEKVAS